MDEILERRIRHKLRAFEEVKKQALASGADLLLICRKTDSAFKSVKLKLKQLGGISKEMDDSLYVHISSKKLGKKIFIPEDDEPEMEPTPEEMHTMIKTLQGQVATLENSKIVAR